MWVEDVGKCSFISCPFPQVMRLQIQGKESHPGDLMTVKEFFKDNFKRM